MASLRVDFELAEELEAMEMYLVEELEGVQRKTHRAKLAQEYRIANTLSAAQSLAKRLKADLSSTTTSQGGLEEFLRQAAELKQRTSNNNKDEDAGQEEEDARTLARIAAWGGREIDLESEEDARVVFRPRTRTERRQSRALIDAHVLALRGDDGGGFSGEEQLGRYVDLHELHLDFQNLADSLRQVSYLDYVRKYVSVLPPPGVVDASSSPQYARYVKRLSAHLLDFERRARPLSVAPPPPVPAAAIELPFESQLSSASSASDLEQQLSLADLKLALGARALKVGGTAQQRAQRLFKVKGLLQQDYPADVKAAAGGGEASSVGVAAAEEESARQALARLQGVLSATVTMITKKLTMTYEEIEQEAKEALLDEAERSDAEEEADDNAQQQHGGEDDDDLAAASASSHQQGKIDPTTGRIIPKWMYRLHGLNKEYRCEICGNQAYFGRRAYDKHFKEFRHANGMKALGIPNTAHFLDITRIDDAQQLYASLRHELQKSETARGMEEFEDADGNVMTRKTYEDLRREGLL